MEKESNETRELKKMKLHVFNIEMEVNVPVEEEQRYRGQDPQYLHHVQCAVAVEVGT